MSAVELRLRTLGRLCLSDAEDREIAASGKHLILLAFLARRAPRAVTREELAALLWGEKDEVRARQSLRQALFRLKRETGDVLAITGSTASVGDAALELDATLFEQHIAAGRLADAVGLWAGDFLAGLDGAGGEEYRVWVETERESLRRRLAWACARLIEQSEAAADPDAALAAAERWVAACPHDQDPMVRLLRLLERHGRAADALARHAGFVHRIREDVGAEPSAALLRLHDDLERSASGGGAAAADVRMPALVGRQPQLATIQAAWTALSRESATFLIEGVAGAGKSRLCREIVRWVERRGEPFVLLEAAAGGDATGPLAQRLFGALRRAPGISGASDAALGELSSLVPSLRERYPDLPRAAGGEVAAARAACEVLSAVAAEVPILIVVDDVAAADEASQALLLALVHKLPPATLILLTARSEELASRSPWTLNGQLHAIRRIALPPLSAADVVAMTGTMVRLGNADREVLAARIFADTAGIPEQVTELVSGLAGRGLITPGESGVWRVAADLEARPLPVPERIGAALRARVERLTPAARGMIEAAAVLGDPVDAELLEVLVGQGAGARTIDELLDARLLRDAPEASGYTFQSELSRRAIYEHVPMTRRQELHAAAAAALDASAGHDAAARARRDAHRARAGTRAARRRRTLVMRAAVVAALIATSGGAVAMLNRDPPLPPLPGDRRVVVAAFDNQTGRTDLDPLGRITADWLTQNIARSARAHVTPPLLLIPERNGAAAAAGSPAAIRAMGAEARADVVIWGAYYLNGDSLRFHASISDASDGRLMRTIEAASSGVSEPMTGVAALARRTMATLAPWLDVRLASSAPVHGAPPSYEAYVALAQGLDYLYRRQGSSALPHFQRAYALDTTYALPLLYAMHVHVGESRPAAADSLARRLLPRRAELAPYERHMLDMFVAGLAGDVPAQYGAARAGAVIAPQSLMAAYWLPASALALNLPGDAIEILEAIDPDRGEAAGLSGYWDYLADAYHRVGEYEAQLRVGREVRRRLPAEVRGPYYLARAYAALGRFDEIDAVLEDGLRMPPIPGWATPGLRLHINAADELRAHGYPERGRAVLERALRHYSDPPQELRDEPRFRFDMSTLFMRLGRLDEARALLEQLLAEGGFLSGPPMVLHAHIAQVAALQGDRATVEAKDRWLREYDPRFASGGVTYYRALIHAIMGDKEETVRLLQQTVAKGGAYGGQMHSEFAFAGMRGYPPFEEWLRPKP